MVYILATLACAVIGWALGIICGVAYGIESERKIKRRSMPGDEGAA